MDALIRAVEVCKGQAALASAIGVKQQHVWNWLNRPGAQVPAEHCPAIERATRDRGQPVLCEELRPDVAWEVLREQAGAPAPQPAAGHPLSISGACPHEGLAVEGTRCLTSALPMARQEDGSLRCEMCAQPEAKAA
jgi:DNA-binding transcriptional regulator YdaS (Cro superfamily)